MTRRPRDVCPKTLSLGYFLGPECSVKSHSHCRKKQDNLIMNRKRTRCIHTHTFIPKCKPLLSSFSCLHHRGLKTADHGDCYYSPYSLAGHSGPGSPCSAAQGGFRVLESSSPAFALWLPCMCCCLRRPCHRRQEWSSPCLPSRPDLRCCYQALPPLDNRHVQTSAENGL